MAPPPRNKALIAGLIKGQWWLIVPQLSPQLRHFLGFYVALGPGPLRFP